MKFPVRLSEVEERVKYQENITALLATSTEGSFQRGANAMEEISKLTGIASLHPESMDRILAEF